MFDYQETIEKHDSDKKTLDFLKNGLFYESLKDYR